MPASPPSPTERMRIALIGSPDCYDMRFDQAQFDALRALGFNTVQINIAWGTRGNDEPLNLEDLFGSDAFPADSRETDWLGEMQRRAAATKAAGFRVLFHAGIPQLTSVKNPERRKRMAEAREDGSVCIQSEAVRARYRHLIGRLGEAIPEVDDFLVYTYDQDAWLCSEFGRCERCRGVPLHDRLPGFLTLLRDTWQEARPEGRLWWEPWELSAGQTYQLLDRLPVEGFGLMLHGNIAEVQLAHRADDWFRNMARWAERRNIPVVGELFLTSSNEEIGRLLHIACPRLIWEGVTAIEALPGVVGIKEYFGTTPDLWDPNLLTAAAALRGEPDLPCVLAEIARAFGPSADALLRAWAALDDALEAWPWNLCWKMRNAPQGTRWMFIAKNGAHLKGHLIDTPAWCSTRRAHYMATENDAYHPWFYEDVVLRWRAAVRYLEAAVAAYDDAIQASPPAETPSLLPWREDTWFFAKTTRRRANWTESTMLADLLRSDLAENRTLNPHWANRLEEILRDDLRNALRPEDLQTLPDPRDLWRLDPRTQDWARRSEGVARELLEAWRQDPRTFLSQYLLDPDQIGTRC